MDVAFTVHLPVDAGSGPLVRRLCRRAPVDRPAVRHGSDGRQRVTPGKRPAPHRTLRLVDPV